MDQGTGQQVSISDSRDTLTRHRFLPGRAGVIELIVLFGMLMVIERLFMSPGDFAKLQPHPYWLPVILLSLQYGTADGVLAAVVAIVVGLVVGSPTQGVGEEYYRYLIRVWTVPIGWITSAIVIGEVRARQRSQMVELTRDLTTTRTQADDITRHCYRLKEKIQRLEREFATVEVNSLDSLTAALEDLARGDAVAWRNTLIRVHRGLLGTGSISVVLRNDHTLTRVARADMASDAETSAHSDPAGLSSLVDAVIASRRGWNALRPGDAAVLDGVAAMAAPLIAEPGGRVLGVIVLETIAPERLTIDTENRLSLMARETAHALAMRGFEDLIEVTDAGARVDIPNMERQREAAPTEETRRRIGLLHRFGRA